MDELQEAIEALTASVEELTDQIVTLTAVLDTEVDRGLTDAELDASNVERTEDKQDPDEKDGSL